MRNPIDRFISSSIYLKRIYGNDIQATMEDTFMFSEMLRNFPSLFPESANWFRQQVDVMTNNTHIWKFEDGLGKEYVNWLNGILDMDFGSGDDEEDEDVVSGDDASDDEEDDASDVVSRCSGDVALGVKVPEDKIDVRNILEGPRKKQKLDYAALNAALSDAESDDGGAFYASLPKPRPPDSDEDNGNGAAAAPTGDGDSEGDFDA